jgi:hypothetical protein
MEARTLERYELLAAWGSALMVALITAVAVPLAAEGAAIPASDTPAAAAVPAPQLPAATR